MRDAHIERLVEIVGERRCLWRPHQVKAYACDGYTAEEGLPRAVVFPETTDEVSRICRYLYENDIPFLPRGAGTGLSGGATPTGGEVVISLARMNKLLAVDFDNLRAVVQPGLVNLTLTRRVSHADCYYAPDPSSQSVCTIGGNFAENAGGSHCLKYGVTTNHVVAAKVVLPDGDVIDIGAPFGDAPGYDLLGLLVGSEGTLGIATEITVRILKKPQALRTALAYFDRVADASDTVTDIIGAGIIPAAIEMMDQLAMQAVDKSNYHVGYPADIEAVLLIEVDGLAAGVDEVMSRVVDICRRHRVREVRVAQSDAERALWWSSRKMAFGAMGRISPDYIVQDGVIPRTRLTEVLQKIDEVSQRYGLKIANVFHAGDGNLHPLILYDSRVPGEAERAVRAGSEVLRACVDAGGSITGEHGVGIEKIGEMTYMFSEDEIDAQLAVKSCFDPKGIVNAGKLIPLPGRCVEVKRARKIIEENWQILDSFPDQAAVQARGVFSQEAGREASTSAQG